MQRKKQLALFLALVFLLLLSLSCNFVSSLLGNSKQFEDGLVQNYHPAASPVSQYTLSTTQQAFVDANGYPDRFTIFFFDEMLPDEQTFPMRHESWYYDARGYEIVFRNGDKFTERTGAPIQIEGLGRTVYSPQGFTEKMNLDALLNTRGETGFFVQNVDDDLITGELIFIKGLAAGFEEGRLSYVETLPLGEASTVAEAPPLVEAPLDDILFQDDFSDTNSGWNRTDTENSLRDYDNGVYRILVKSPNYSAWAIPHQFFEENVSIEVDATTVSREDDKDYGYGVICRYSGSKNSRNFYFFTVSNDGEAIIGKVVNHSSEYISSEKMQPYDVIKQGAATNHLRADCIGDNLTFYVNGEEIISTRDSSFTSGGIGFVAATIGAPSTEITFDNLIVRKP
ncbi:MAG: hypothetical protein HN736_13885 [Anaerolineae bacterium]|jgi:hypothetical protein|nr:hypothetical protein [Anaerolineae bacterium]MBT3714250.1 hypothetical protein [Anaerolineae bacterium]MBT4312060.1 hypothetical protein [Anaerolineae bacterium]MBT4459448.1 hypothetical protein [Anaerolineae bacterium]MBT4842048.1 hypothetical protein [Anaerolineae bacterium]